MSDRVNREVSPSRSLLRNRSRILGSERKKQDRSRIERRHGAARGDTAASIRDYCASFLEIADSGVWFLVGTRFFRRHDFANPRPDDERCDRHRTVVIALIISRTMTTKWYLRNAFKCYLPHRADICKVGKGVVKKIMIFDVPSLAISIRFLFLHARVRYLMFIEAHLTIVRERSKKKKERYYREKETDRSSSTILQIKKIWHNYNISHNIILNKFLKTYL